MQKAIEKAERNIRQALKDYGAHTDNTRVLDDISNDFIARLAKDSVEAKWELRQLFRKSPVWNEELDALVINGTRTHNPDYVRVCKLANEILLTPRCFANCGTLYRDIDSAIQFFANPKQDEEHRKRSIEAINRLAPKAYAPEKKPSRVFKSMCVALGAADETAGSDFQRLYAQFADELSAKKISFKLYVSINPAHFLTMSNPKGDDRGNTLTSCHSLNSTEYEYNNGCSGYARDKTSIIVFTVADPDNPETFNNRKTTRQIFAYKPGGGLLLQSRMYNTSGGTFGAQEDSKLYRDLVQREISMLEEVPNLWKTGKFVSGIYRDSVKTGCGFGGYPDWIYGDFDAHVSIRADHANDWEPIEVGTYGLCIRCGQETENGLYCEDCEQGSNYCDDCEQYTDDELTTVYNSEGGRIQVCQYCLEDHYRYCDVCNSYYPYDEVRDIDGDCLCDDCRDEYCEECDYCGEEHRRSDMILVDGIYGGEAWVCNDDYCLWNYPKCDNCEGRHHEGVMTAVYLADGLTRDLCEDCAEDYDTCPECGVRIEICGNGACPHCGAVILEEAKAV